MYVRVFDNAIKPGDKIQLMATGKAFEVEEVGVFLPDMTPVDQLGAGAVGYLIAGVREIATAKIGEHGDARQSSPHPVRCRDIER